MRAVFVLAAVAALAAASCAGRCVPDTDNEQYRAMRISPGVLVKDSIGGGCDQVDWKDFSYFQDVRATVTFVFGEAYKRHGVRGEITLFSFDGNLLQRQAVVPDTREYVFRFPAQKDKDYFFKVQAESGQSGYMVETRTEPLEGCGQCEPGSVCRDGACVRSGDCVPACGRDEVCASGRCEPACVPSCRGGKRCDASSRRCVAAAPASATRVPEPKKKGCPQCGSGEACNPETSQCEAAVTGIQGSVLGVIDDGGQTILLVNRGSQDGVRRGATGRVGGFGFVVVEATATRCKARVNGATPDQLKGLGRVTISR